VALAFGCGGRTSALDGDYGFTESGAANQGGSSVTTGGTGSAAGRPGHAGTGTVQGGSQAVGGTRTGTAGSYTGGYPSAGAVSYGGTGTGGAHSVGGYGYGAYGTGGYPYGGFPAGGFSTAGAPAQDCLSCFTQACGPQLGQCIQDFGCLAIFNCISSKGCQAYDCYTPQWCRGVIDQWGGPAGASMKEVLSAFNCAVQAGCQCN